MDEFISTANYNELKNSSKKWFFTILSLLFLEVTLLSFIHYKQNLRLKHLLSEIQTLEFFIESQQPVLENKSKLKEEYDSLLNKKTYLIGNTYIPKVILKRISKVIPADCCLSAISFKNNIITVTGIAKTWTSLNNFFELLSTMDKLGSIRLKSSTKAAQYLNFEIEFRKKK